MKAINNITEIKKNKEKCTQHSNALVLKVEFCLLDPFHGLGKPEM